MKLKLKVKLKMKAKEEAKAKDGAGAKRKLEGLRFVGWEREAGTGGGVASDAAHKGRKGREEPVVRGKKRIGFWLLMSGAMRRARK